MLRMLKLITGEVVFGEVEGVVVGSGATAQTEILVKKPFTATSAGIMPYLVDIMANAPGAFQIHPMNVLFQLPLDEFPEVLTAYETATSVLVKPEQKIIV